MQINPEEEAIKEKGRKCFFFDTMTLSVKAGGNLIMETISGCLEI